MTVLSRLGNDPTSIGVAMQARWRLMLVLGAVLVVLGILGLHASSLVAHAMTLLVAALLVIAGALQLSQAFLLRGMLSFAITIALGAAQVIAGVAIYTHPEWAAYAIALTVTVVLAVQALALIGLALRFEAGGKRWVPLVSGLAALVAAFISVAGVAWAGRASASWGVGLALLSMGLAYIGIALLLRRDRARGRGGPGGQNAPSR